VETLAGIDKKYVTEFSGKYDEIVLADMLVHRFV